MGYKLFGDLPGNLRKTAESDAGGRMREKISVIVPVYGVEKMLARCVESILAQTYEKYRIGAGGRWISGSVSGDLRPVCSKNIKILW